MYMISYVLNAGIGRRTIYLHPLFSHIHTGGLVESQLYRHQYKAASSWSCPAERIELISSILLHEYIYSRYAVLQFCPPVRL